MDIKAIVVIGRISETPMIGAGDPKVTYLSHFSGSVDVIEATDERYFYESDRGVTINDRTNGPLALTLVPWHRIGEVQYAVNGRGRYV